MERSFEPVTTINIQLMRDYPYINMNPSSSDEEIFWTQRHSKPHATDSGYDTDRKSSV